MAPQITALVVCVGLRDLYLEKIHQRQPQLPRLHLFLRSSLYAPTCDLNTPSLLPHAFLVPCSVYSLMYNCAVLQDIPCPNQKALTPSEKKKKLHYFGASHWCNALSCQWKLAVSISENFTSTNWANVVYKSAPRCTQRWTSHPRSWETSPIPQFHLYTIFQQTPPSWACSCLTCMESETSVVPTSGVHRGSRAHPISHGVAVVWVFFLAFWGPGTTARNRWVFLLHLLQYLQHLELTNTAVSRLLIYSPGI